VKLLLFSDLHCDATAAKRLAANMTDIDVVIGAGDFGSSRHDLEVCIGPLQSIDRPVILVPGNNESLEELQEACVDWPQAHILHGSGVEIDGVTFFGIGGGIPVTPFGAWSYDFTEEQAADLLAACPNDAVLISHSPPQGIVDTSSRGESLGSVAVRDAILRTRPRLVVCGHVHACAGRVAVLDDIPVVNAGPMGLHWELV